MIPAAVNFAEKLSRIDAPWSPRVVAELNDYQFKLVKIHGDFVWHRHDDTDEAFLVQSGRLQIDFRDAGSREATVTLGAGEMIVVPRGIEHRPHADAECHVLLIEPRGTVNTGDAGGAMTAANDVWV